MENQISTLHIPIDRTLRDRLDTKAKRLGFGSAQAYIRVWAMAEAEGRTLSFGEDDWGEPTPEAAARLHRLAAEALSQIKTGDLPAYHTADDFLTSLHNAKGD
jgi:hypothetical protein